MSVHYVNGYNFYNNFKCNVICLEPSEFDGVVINCMLTMSKLNRVFD